MNGCAVVYDPISDSYMVYNREESETRVSPFSTFKIISTLMGLHNSILIDENTYMGYNQTRYPVEDWNKDVTLKEAFQTSCVWYFRKLIDKIGREEVSYELNDIGYGNCDVSEWEGSGVNPLEDLNGFWLDSSLQISPMEQVQVLKTIFEGSSIYSQSELTILKEVMSYDSVNGYDIYGKTGTGIKDGWYVDLIHKEDRDYYFAIYLNGEDLDIKVSGSYAKEIIKEMVASEQFPE